MIMFESKTTASSVQADSRCLTAEETSAVAGGMLAAAVIGDKVFLISSDTMPFSNSHVAVVQR